MNAIPSSDMHTKFDSEGVLKCLKCFYTFSYALAVLSFFLKCVAFFFLQKRQNVDATEDVRLYIQHKIVIISTGKILDTAIESVIYKITTVTVDSSKCI